MEQPIDRLKKDLSQFTDAVAKFRGSVRTEILRLPAPDPLREALKEVDQMVASAERGLVDAIGAIRGR